MILSLPEIQTILLTNPGQKRIAKGVEYSKKLRRHIYGEEMDTHFKQIEGMERPSLKELRVKYSKSNKDLFSRLGRPLDKVFTARGGSTYFNLGEQQERTARQLISDVRDGYSARKWVEVFWKAHMLDDPFGLLFLEIEERPKAVQLKQQGKPFVYPTYKSISEIYDYLPKGNKVEWVVFNVTKQQLKAQGLSEDLKVFRVVDDAFDYWVKLEGETAVVIQTHTLQNYFGEVPAMVNTDFIDPSNENCFLSLYDEIIELADHFLLKGSLKITHDFLHAFPKYAEFADVCGDCGGHGKKDGHDCPTCKGSGRRTMSRVSDVKAMEWPTKEDHLISPANVAAYISPDKVFHEIATTDLLALEDVMSVTLWGTQSKLKTQGTSLSPDGMKTATEVMDEMKPQADRLTPVSEMAEKRIAFVVDSVIRMQVAPGYSGSSVNLGRRYLLEGPDAIFDKYSKARKDSAPQSVLDALLNEYYETVYQADPVSLAMAKKLMYTEPFVHYSASGLKALNPDPADYRAKLYFSEWLAEQPEGLLLSKSVADLKTSLYEYAGNKTIPAAKELPAA